MKFFFLLFVSFLFSFSGISQNTNNFWYFGFGAGLDFSSGTAVPLGDGAISTLEGCGTISDPVTGDLLFYTDGSTVYNANHSVMPNGSGLNGHSSSTQSAVIVKKPNTSNIYTIFTMYSMGFGTVLGLQYSEVDMTLDGGLGDVNAVKNVPIYTDCTEKLVVIQHQNNTDFWIVVRDDATSGFLSFLYTSSGINLTGVSSLAGEIPSLNTQGYFRASIGGDKIASAFFSDGVYLYDYDNSTGVASFGTPIILPMNNAYGVEFSPNGQYLYVSSETSSTTVGNLFQYDLLAGSEADIIDSRVALAFDGVIKGALQLGPDQIIYVSQVSSNYIGSISNPNVAGVGCNYDQFSYFFPNGATCGFGLPTFQNNSNEIIEPNVICLGDTITLNTTLPNPNWALEVSPNVVFSTDSFIEVSPLVNTNYLSYSGTDTVIHVVNVFDQTAVSLGPDICDTTGIVELSVFTTTTDVNYLWSNDSTNSSIEVTETGVYWVEVSNSECSARDSIFVQFEDITIEFPDEVICDSIVELLANDSNSIAGEWTYVGPPGSIGLVEFSPSSNHKNPTVTVPVLAMSLS